MYGRGTNRSLILAHTTLAFDRLLRGLLESFGVVF